METHTVDQETGEYLGGPTPADGAPYRIGSRTPYWLVYIVDGQLVRLKGWFENANQAAEAMEDGAHFRSSAEIKWSPQHVESISYADYTRGRRRKGM